MSDEKPSPVTIINVGGMDVPVVVMDNPALAADAPAMLDLLAEATAWLEDPSGYAQDDARGFDARVRALLDKHGRG